MKKNTIIWTAASAISAFSAPLVYWGVKAALKKNPNPIEKITEAVKKEIQAPVQVVKQEEPEEKQQSPKRTSRAKAAKTQQETTEEGQTIFMGAKGGRYTLDKNGKKHYLKK